jgi:uncharacterized lipoprotein YmbA
MRRAILLLALLLAGCATAQPPALFTLAPVAGATLPARAGAIELRRVGLAGYLDRDAIVLSAAGYRLRLAANEHWAEPLGKMLDRVLSQDLAQRLPASTVFTEAGAIGGDARLVLEINIERLDADADGTVVLRAQVALHPDGRKAPPRTETLRLAATPAGPGTAELVATMSGLLGQLADRVAGMVQGTGRK